MERYNYRDAISNDIRDFIKDNNITVDEDREEMGEHLYDILWVEDSVTGKGSGSYTFNRWVAEEYICHNWDLFEEAAQEYGMKRNVPIDPESMDVTIRCYLLGECLAKVLDEMEETI